MRSNRGTSAQTAAFTAMRECAKISAASLHTSLILTKTARERIAAGCDRMPVREICRVCNLGVQALTFAKRIFGEA